jgi:hypothetical protein
MVAAFPVDAVNANPHTIAIPSATAVTVLPLVIEPRSHLIRARHARRQRFSYRPEAAKT